MSKHSFLRRARSLTDLLADFTDFSMVRSEGNHEVRVPALYCTLTPQGQDIENSPHGAAPQTVEDRQVFDLPGTFLVTDSEKEGFA